MGHDLCLAVEVGARHVISPNIHVILVHFPLGIFVFGLFLEVFGLFFWRHSTARVAAHWMILFGGLLAIPAALTGIDALSDVANHSRPKLTLDQWALLRKHVLVTSIGAGVAALTVTAALGLADVWRKRLVLYFPLLLLLIGAASLLVFGSHFGGEGIYLNGTAVGLTGDTGTGFEYWAPAQSTHVLLAGLGTAIALGALGMSVRVLHRTRLGEEEAVTDRELAALAAGEPAPTEGTVTVAPPAARVPAGANDLVVARSLNEDAAFAAMPRVPAGRFWVLCTALFALALGFGVWLLISQEESDWLANNKPTASAIWQEVYSTATATKQIGQNRRGAHVVIGAAIIVLPLILALAVRFGPRRRAIVGVLCLVMLLLVAAEIWLGILLLHDSSEGPLWRFTPPDTSMLMPPRI